MGIVDAGFLVARPDYALASIMEHLIGQFRDRLKAHGHHA